MKVFDAQLKQCNRLAEEAKKVLSQEDTDEEQADDATAKLYQVKRGMPTHRQFLRMMEDAAIRKRFEKFDLDMNSDYNKERAHKLKEDLNFVIDEKNQQADLTEKGRALISPNDPEGFVIPDLATLYVEIDRKNELSEDDKRREGGCGARIPGKERANSYRFPAFESIRFIREGQAVCSAKFKGYDCR